MKEQESYWEKGIHMYEGKGHYTVERVNSAQVQYLWHN